LAIAGARIIFFPLVHRATDRAQRLVEKACALGCEGIVSKKLGSRYVSGRSDTWIKTKNPKAAAATRVWEEDWGR
jgi:ATP-dependent DNA ligase